MSFGLWALISSGTFWPGTRFFLGSFTRFSFSAVPEIVPVGHTPWHPSPVSLATFLKPSSLVHFSSHLCILREIFSSSWLITFYLPLGSSFPSAIYYSIDFDLPLNLEYGSLVMESLIFLPNSSMKGKYLHSIFFVHQRRRKSRAPAPPSTQSISRKMRGVIFQILS